jgi:hypothetical protein
MFDSGRVTALDMCHCMATVSVADCDTNHIEQGIQDDIRFCSDECLCPPSSQCVACATSKKDHGLLMVGGGGAMHCNATVMACVFNKGCIGESPSSSGA